MTPSYDNKNWFPKLDHRWFHSIFAILMTVVLSACSGSATSTPVSDVDQSTPEAAIRSLNDAITRGDIRAVESFVYPGDKASEDFLRGFSQFVAEGGVSYVTDLRIDVVANDGKIARARTSEHDQVVLKSGKILLDEPTGDLYTLVKRDDRWYFVGLGQQVPPGWIAGQKWTPESNSNAP